MPRYRDYIGTTFETIEELAEYRIRVQAPLLGGAICPAVQYNFSVSNDADTAWRNPDPDEREALHAAVVSHEGCCRNLGGKCPAITDKGPEFP